MKKQIFLIGITLLVIAGLSSCRHKLECKGFDTNESVMKWYFTSENDNSLTFIDENSTTYTFNQTNFYQTSSATIKCPMWSKCGCPDKIFSSDYSNSDLGLTLGFKANYREMGDNSTTWKAVTLTQNDFGTELIVDDNEIQLNDSYPEIIYLTNITLLNHNFTDLYEITSIDSTFKFWLKKDVGLIGFEKDSTIYLKQ